MTELTLSPRRTRAFLACVPFLITLSLAMSCEAPEGQNGALGKDQQSGPSAVIPTEIPGAQPAAVSQVQYTVGPSCHSGDASRICLGLKYVVYRDGSGTPVVSKAEAQVNLQVINGLFSQCGLAFQIDQYVAVNPADHQLQYQTASFDELDSIRSTFNDGKTILLVTTGTWNRYGSLAGSANAWTNLPGGGPFGAIMEKPVGTYGNIIAHELGHYLNLDHVNDAGDLMNPVIYTTSSNLYSSQCQSARAAARYFWSSMYR